MISDWLEQKSRLEPDRVAFVFLESPHALAQVVTYGHVYAAVQKLTHTQQLHLEKGDRVVLFFEQGFEFVVAFFAVLQAGGIAVPLHLPKSLNRVKLQLALLGDCNPKFALTQEKWATPLQQSFREAGSHLAIYSLARLIPGPAGKPSPPEMGDVVFLQYSSGSTGQPKGVMVTHGSLVANMMAIEETFGTEPEDLCVSWLPAFHDMGLIGCILHAVYRGFPTVLLTPSVFAKNPLFWLETLSNYRGTLSGGPNFGFSHVLSKLSHADVPKLDLASWRVAFNGAEPIQAEVLEEFSRILEPCGFSKSAFFPCYGLAEATLLLAGAPLEETSGIVLVNRQSLDKNHVAVVQEGDPSRVRTLVCCGPVIHGHELVVVDPETGTRCPEGWVGELWAAGTSLARGYWQNSQEASKGFELFQLEGGQRKYFRTGDLGFLRQGRLYLTGRLNDLLIIRGKNLYPEDIETSVRALEPAFGNLATVAFSVSTSKGEALVVLQEIPRFLDNGQTHEALMEKMTQALVERFDVAPAGLGLVKPGTLLKTTSGKIRRKANKKRFLEKGIHLVAFQEKKRECEPGFNSVAKEGPNAGNHDGEVLDSLRQILSEAVEKPIGAQQAERSLSELGLDSVAAAAFARGVEARFGLEIPTDQALPERSLRDVAVWISGQIANRHPSPVLPTEDGPTLIPLSPGQEALWYLHQMDPGSSMYHIYFAVKISPQPCWVAVKNAFLDLMEKHGALRTIIQQDLSEVGQKDGGVHDRFFTVMDVSQLGSSHLHQQIHKTVQEPFQVNQGSMWRCVGFQGQEASHLLVVMHHLIGDHHSLISLMAQWGESYALALQGKGSVPRNPSLPRSLSFGEYQKVIEDLRANASGSQAEADRQFWRNHLQNIPTQLQLPYDFSPPVNPSFQSASLPLSFPHEIQENVEALARAVGGTPFMVFCTVYQLFLHRYTQQEHLLVGTPVSLRKGRAQYRSIGYFANAVCLKSQYSKTSTLRQFLEKGIGGITNAFGHRRLPFHEVVKEMGGTLESSSTPLFQALFVWQQTKLIRGASPFGIAGSQATVNLGGHWLEHLPIETGTTPFDLSLVIAPDAKGYVGEFVFRQELFAPQTMARILKSFKTFFQGAMSDPEQPCNAIPLLTPEEITVVGRIWNDRVIRRSPAALPVRFQQWAERLPDSVALVVPFENNHLRITYGALNRWAANLAAWLLKKGIRSGDFVAVCFDRTEKLVVSLLALGRVNAVYVPLDPNYPTARFESILWDCNAKFVMTEMGFKAKFDPFDLEVLVLTTDPKDLQTCPEPSREFQVAPECLSHVIYTSGSTGKPKGVLINHRATAQLMDALAGVYSDRDLQSVLASTSICFDLSVFEIHGTLARGGKIVLLKDALALAETRLAHEVELVNTVPSAIKELLRADAVPPSVRVVNLAGEALSKNIVDAIYQKTRVERVFNLYGPSEDTTYSTVSWVKEDSPGPPSIGHVLGGSTAFVLDSQLRILPPGVLGELFLGGEGLANGYYQSPRLTAASFVPNPFSTSLGERLYKTGDWVRFSALAFDANGVPDLLFQGRRDQQVKIRGFRIELEEIKAVLEKHPEVDASIVLAVRSPSGEPVLGAYVVKKDGNPLKPIQGLTRELGKKLPFYMVPSLFGYLESIPLTPNGKINYKALPNLWKMSQKEAEKSQLSALAKTMRSLWQEVLGIEDVPLDVPFFELGGHSLLAAKLATRIESALGFRVPLRMILQAGTLENLVRTLETLPVEAKTQKWPSLVRVPEAKELSFSQQRLWFIHQLEPGNSQYNLTAMFELSGPLNLLALFRSVHLLVSRHEVLRQAFYLEGDTPAFRLQAGAPFSVIDLGGLDNASHPLGTLKESISNLVHQLEAGKLFRVFLLKVTREKCWMCLSLHHAIADGWSLQVMAKELSTAYHGFSQPPSLEKKELEPLPVQYSDYAHWQHVCHSLGLFQQGIGFWTSALAGALPLLRLPLDHARPPRLSHRLGIHSFSLSQEAVQSLETLVKIHGTTKFTLLGCLFGIFLGRISSQNDVVFGTPVANRPHPSLEPLIGFFANTVCLRMNVEETDSFEAHLETFQALVEQALTFQETPFEKIVEALRLERDLSHHPLFQAFFVYEQESVAHLNLGAVSVSRQTHLGSQAKFDVSLYLKETESGLQGHFEYEADLFLPETLMTWQRVFDQMLVQLMGSSKVPLKHSVWQVVAEKNLQQGTQPVICNGYSVDAERLRTLAEEMEGIGKLAVLAQFHNGLEELVVHGETSKSQTEFRNALASHLKRRLPKFMVPDRYVAWQSLPLTPSGDPDPDALSAKPLTEEHISKPGATVESTAEIRAIWEEVLQREPLEMEDHFFELGGTSLSAIRLVSRVQEKLGAKISVRTLFEAPTLGEFLDQVRQTDSERAPEFRLDQVLPEAAFALSAAQSRMWFLEEYSRNLEPGTQPDYWLFATLKSQGILDLGAVQDSLRFLAQRHESLRTTFKSHQGMVQQSVGERPGIHLEVLDVAALGAPAQFDALTILKQKANLFRPPLEDKLLFKFLYVSQGNQSGIFFFLMHHLLSDRWSLELLIREFVHCYKARLGHHPPELSLQNYQYRHYLSWQHTWEASSEGQKARDFWENFLRDAPKGLNLPRRNRLPLASFESQEIPIEIDGILTKHLDSFAGTCGVTPFMILQAVLALTLKHYGCGDDLILGTPFANRKRAEFQTVVGLMVNTLVLRPNISGNPTFELLCQRLKETSLRVMEQGDYPFERILEIAAEERDPLFAPYVQVMLVVEDRETQAISLPGCIWERELTGNRNAKFELTLSFTRQGKGFHGTLGFLKHRFDYQLMERFARHFSRVLAQSLNNPQQKIGDLQVLSSQEFRLLHQEWSHNGQTPRDASQKFLPVARLVSENTRALKDKIAVGGGARQNHHLTYDFLQTFANRIRNRINDFGLGPERVIAIFGPREAWHVAAMLAIQEGGWVWLSLPDSLPKDRLREYIADAGVALILAETSELESETSAGVPVLCLERLRSAPEGDSLPAMVQPSQLAYLIYTSGSTGRPKAVASTQQGLARLAEWHWREFEVDQDHRASQTADFSFDASVWEIWPYLAVGASVFLLPEALKFDGRELGNWLRSHQITHAFLTTVLAEELARSGWEVPHLQWLLTGGDRLKHWPESTAGPRWVNNYGPTENTVVATCAILNGPQDGPPPIGRPIDHVSVWVLDAQMNLLPPGVEGELFLGGAGLARGYLERFGQTAANFVPHPFSALDGRSDALGARLYRTGDRVKFLENGSLEFLGRTDRQFKLSGFRIELGEIEATLKNEPAILDAVVLGEESETGKVLRAFVAVNLPEDFDAFRLQTRLNTKLPRYMIPTRFHVLEELPRLASGKPDRAKLQSMSLENVLEVGPEAFPLQSDLEKKMAQAWSEFFQKPIENRAANFFNLGGHSLGAAHLIHRCSEVLGRTLPLHLIFEAPVLGEFCDRIRQIQTTPLPVASPALRAGDDQGPFALSAQQSRLWFFHQLHPASMAYNMPFRLSLEGPLDVGALAKSLEAICQKHRVLGGAVRTTDGVPYLHIHPARTGLRVWDGSHLHEAQRESLVFATLQPFRLEENLFRAVLIRWDASHHLLILDVHHLVFDGQSLGIFLEELEGNYSQRLMSSSLQPSALPLQYYDYARWQREQLQKGMFEDQRDYWKTKLHNLPELNLPLDRHRGEESTHQGEFAARRLARSQLLALHRVAQSHNQSLFIVLLAAFKVLLSKHAGLSDVAIGIPMMARTLPELRKLIGFFVNTAVVRTALQPQMTFREYADHVNRTMQEAHRNQEVPFDQVVGALQPKRERHKTPLFQIFFNMVGRIQGPPQLRGLKAEVSAPPVLESKFDMTLYAVETQEGLLLQLHYNPALFDHSRIETYLDQYQDLLNQVTDNPESPLALLSLSRASCRSVLPNLSEPLLRQAEQPIYQTILAECRRRKDAIAASMGHSHLTYGLLDGLSQVLGSQLKQAGVGPGKVVVVLASRCLELLPAMLGVFRRRCILALVDTEYPIQRVRTLIESIAPSALVFSSQDAQLASEMGSYFPHMTLIPVPTRANQPDSSTDLHLNADVDAPAYVLFTSGTTGKPQAVVSSHRPLSHFASWQKTTFGLHSATKVSMLSGVGHDPLLRDVLVTLSYGGHVVIPPANPVKINIKDWLCKNAVNSVHLTPAMSILIRGNDPQAVTLPDLRFLFFGGDRLTHSHLEQAMAWAPKARMVNFYGTTETPQAMAFHVFEQGHLQARSVIPLGKGIPQVQLLVLNEADGLCGVGELGQIWVRTPYLSLGYLSGDPEDEEKIKPLSGRVINGERYYRTGDLGRYNAQGEVVFSGRRDRQVKIRGQRVELAELEACARAFPPVSDAAAWFVESREEVILFWEPIPSSHQERDQEALNRHLAKHLPQGVIPQRIQAIEKMPLTPNRKIDFEALAQIVSPSLRTFGVDTFSTLEAWVAEIWQEILQVPVINPHQNFFELGGHSLHIGQLLARLRAVFEVNLDPRVLFDRPTLRDFCQVVAEIQGRPVRTPLVLAKGTKDRTSPLSFSQERLWLLEQIGDLGSAYHISHCWDILGRVSVPWLEASWKKIVDRHSILRTRIVLEDGEPRQLADGTDSDGLLILDATAVASHQRTVQDIISVIGQEKFDYAQAPPWRAALIVLGSENYKLCLTFHHLIADGWSLAIVMEELSHHYAAFSKNSELNLPPLKARFGDFAQWQRQVTAAEMVQPSVKYWLRALDLPPAVLEFPTDFPRPAVQRYRGATISFSWDPAMTQRINQASLAQGVTPFMFLLSAWATLLSRYTHQEDMILGIPVAGRSLPEFEKMVGFFANTLPLRIRPAMEMPFQNLLQQVKTAILNAMKHEQVPLETVLNQLNLPRNLSHHALFQVMFIYQNAPEKNPVFPGLQWRHQPVYNPSSKFDMTLSCTQSGGCIQGVLEYNKDLYLPETMIRLMDHFERMCQSFLDKTDALLGAVRFLSEKELRDLREWASLPAQENPFERLDHWIFEALRNDPDRALLCGEETFREEANGEGGWWTRRQFLAQTRYWSRELRALGVGPGAAVGVCMERTPTMVMALLAILKSGGFYVPLDPSFPPERLDYILHHAQPKWILTDPVSESSLPPFEATRVRISANPDMDAELPIQWELPVCKGGESQFSAYQIYTSGSTGKPKGVRVTHGNVINLLTAMATEPGLSERDTFLAVTTLSFDIACLELFLPLVTGARLVIAKTSTQSDPDQLATVARVAQVTAMQATPSTWEMLREVGWVPQSRMKLLCGGEALPSSLGNWFSELDAAVWNLYGPTETTIWSSRYALNHLPSTANPSVPLGRPIDHTSLHVLARNLHPVPSGVVGELYIGGAGVTLGYQCQPGKTAEAFIPNPFASGAMDAGSRLYKTGDLVRFQRGELFFVGRKDFQVKLRGFRIELGEIEHALASHSEVAQAVAVLHTSPPAGETLLVYVLLDPQGTYGASDLPGLLKDLKDFVSSQLPHYMVPAQIDVLEEFPKTANGKIDRKALAKRSPALTQMVEVRQPESQLEHQLLEIWQTVLGRHDFGVNQDFFELGGHSLQATKVIGRIRQKLGRDLPIRSIFQAPTVAQFASLLQGEVTQAPEHAISQTIPAQTGSVFPVSSAQKRMWFLQQTDPSGCAYNMTQAVKISGQVVPSLIEKTMEEIIRRHEALRTHFFLKDGDVFQEVLATPCRELRVIDLGTLPSAQKENQRQTLLETETRHPFPLEGKAPFRYTLIAEEPTRAILLLNAHHILADGWSLALFFKEFQAGYQARLACKENSEHPLPIQYKDFSVWQNAQIAEGHFESQKAYWMRQLQALPLPVEIGNIQGDGSLGKSAGVVTVELEQALIRGVEALAGRSKLTPFMVYLAGFQLLMHRLTLVEDQVVGVPIANRTHPQLEALIGCFANTLVFRTEVRPHQSFLNLVEEVKVAVLGAFENQDYPFDLVVENFNPQRSQSDAAMFNHLFIFQNIEMEELTGSGMKLEPVETPVQAAKFDLVFSLGIHGGGIRIRLEYSRSRWTEAGAANLAKAFGFLLNQAMAQPEKSLGQLPMPKIPARYYQVQPAHLNGRAVVHAGMSGYPVDSQGAAVLEGAWGYLQVEPNGLTYESMGNLSRLKGWPARSLANGHLVLAKEFNGWVHLRGQWFSVEEIERKLLEIPEIQDLHGWVRSTSSGEEVWVIYLVPFGPLSLSRLKETLGSLLETFPIPWTWEPVARLPLRKDGSVDRRSLLNIPVNIHGLLNTWQTQLETVNPSTALLVTMPEMGMDRLYHLGDVWPEKLHTSHRAKASGSRVAAKDPATPKQKAGTAKLAYGAGPPLVLPRDAPQTLTQALEQTAWKYPSRGITFLHFQGDVTHYPYPRLFSDALRGLTLLRSKGLRVGDVVILQIESLLDHLPIFWSCLLGGMVPVTIAVPRAYTENDPTCRKLISVWRALNHPPVLCSQPLQPPMELMAQEKALVSFESIPVSEFRNFPPEELPHVAKPSDTAFMQLTSGSTGVPKAIPEVHSAVIAHIHSSQQFNGYSESDRTLNWLPFDHVVPILTFHLKDVYLGIEAFQAPTQWILEDPLRWLTLLSNYQITHSWSPNFGFKLAAMALQQGNQGSWNLNHVKFLMNAGEQVTLSTMRSFLEHTQPFGLRAQALQPAFGMAEVCTCMTYHNGFDARNSVFYLDRTSLGGVLCQVPPDHPDAVTFVKLGPVAHGAQMRIVDSENRLKPEGVIGRFQIKGPMVMPGYYQNHEANEEAFVGEGWFNSGDLGFILEGELALTGREKEIIIINGANFGCYEVEDVVGRVEGVLPAHAAVTSVFSPELNAEEMVVFFVPTQDDLALQIPILRAIRAQIGEHFGLHPRVIIPLPKSEFARTTSGKIQRLSMKDRLVKGAFDDLIRKVDLLLENENTLPKWFYESHWVRRELNPVSVKGVNHVLLFSDSFGLGEGLAALLRQSKIQVTMAYPGADFLAEMPGVFKVHPSDRHAYQTLLEAIPFPDWVIHSWAYGVSEAQGSQGCEGKVVSEGVFSLLAFCQAYQEVYQNRNSTLVIASQAHSYHRPHRFPRQDLGLLQGFVGTLSVEMPWLKLRLVDFDEPIDKNHAEHLFQEAVDPRKELRVLYRKGRRFLPRLRAVSLSEPTRNAASVVLREQGVYLISGGMGALGFELAKYLLDRYQATLLLMGRKNEPSQEDMEESSATFATRLETLKALKGRVHYFPGDICEGQTLTRIIENFESTTGKEIEGVFHLAGVLRECPLQRESPSTLLEVLRPKVEGARSLMAFLQSRPKAFMVNFSSSTATFGTALVGAYAAANSYLDSLAESHPDSRVFTIQWSAWNHLGMTLSSQRDDVLKALGFDFIDPPKGFLSMELMMKLGVQRPLVGIHGTAPAMKMRTSDSPLAFHRAILCYEKDRRPSAFDPYSKRDVFGVHVPLEEWALAILPRAEDGTLDPLAIQSLLGGSKVPKVSYVQPEEGLEDEIAQIWSTVLGGNPGVTHNFFDLGGTSIAAAQIAGQLGKRYPISVIDLFQYPTIRELSKHLSQSAPQGESVKEGISRAQLRQKRGSQQRGRRRLHEP